LYDHSLIIADFDLVDRKKSKIKKTDNPGFLGYKGNISFLTEKLRYVQICGTKLGPSLKNGVNAFASGNEDLIIWLLQKVTRHPFLDYFQAPTMRNLELIDLTIDAKSCLIEDIKKSLTIRADNGIRRFRSAYKIVTGLKNVMTHFENDVCFFITIIFVLISFKFDNDPNIEQIWPEKRSTIFENFPIARAIHDEDWEKVSTDYVFKLGMSSTAIPNRCGFGSVRVNSKMPNQSNA